jgi:hypothetical protein
MNGWHRILAGAVLMAVAGVACAHEGSTSYLAVNAVRPEARVTARFDVSALDVALSASLDADADGRVTWREIEGARAEVAGLVARGLRIARGGESCALAVGAPWLTERLGLPYLSFDIAADCTADGPLAISSDLFFDTDTYHRMLVSLRTASATHAATLAPGARRWSEPLRSSAWGMALAFLRQGMVHVWIGYDHLVFLLLLLLPAVAGSRARASGRAIALDLARIVTAFTVAHSITLGLAATAVVRLPPQAIEVAIAASLVVAGALNLAPRLWRLRLPLAFGFGLVHGFGFANALAGLDTGDAPVLPVLAGFNVGVELANLAAVAVLLPLLLWLARFAWYAPRAMPAMSLASAALGALWMVQRF